MRGDDGLVVKLEAMNGLYLLQTLSTPMCGSVRTLQEDGDAAGNAGAKRAALWHFRLGHLETDAVRELSLQENTIPKLPVVPRCVCTGYVYGKMNRKPFPSLPLSL